MDSAKETWTPVIKSEKLKNFNIFALDLHGHGETQNQNDIFTTEQMVEDIHNFIQENSIPPFFIVGHSMGSRVAIPYCAKYPKTVRGLVIEDMDIKKYEIPKKNPEELKKFSDIIDSEKELFLEYEKFGYKKDQVNKWLEDGRIKKIKDKFYCGIRPYVTFSSAKNLLGTDDAKYAFESLASLNVDILLMEAEKFSAISKKSLEEMKKINPKMKHVLVKNSTHSIHKDESHDEFISILISFLNEKLNKK